VVVLRSCPELAIPYGPSGDDRSSPLDVESYADLLRRLRWWRAMSIMQLLKGVTYFNPTPGFCNAIAYPHYLFTLTEPYLT
jgi:hypothetical protein